MSDPIVDEVRKYRSEHSEKFGNDLTAICEDLRRTQVDLGLEVMSLPSKPIDRGKIEGTLGKTGAAVA